MSQIKGKLKKEVTLNGVTYKVGEEISVPTQFGLEDYFESFITVDQSREKGNDNIKTNR